MENGSKKKGFAGIAMNSKEEDKLKNLVNYVQKSVESLVYFF